MGFRRWGPSLAIALLLAAPVLPIGLELAPSLRSGGASITGIAPSGTASSIPSALMVPWAGRAGFDPAVAEAAVGATAAVGNLTVALTLWPRDPGLFVPPGSNAPRLDANGIADRFGRTASEYTHLEQYFVDHGLRITHTFPDRLALTVEGPTLAVDAAFGTDVLRGTLAGRPVQFPTSVPSLPEPLASEVAAVSGLAGGTAAFQVPFDRLPTPSAPTPSQGRTTRTVSPNVLHSIYGFDQLYNYSGGHRYATGTGIALVLWGAGYDPSDIQQYFSSFYPSEFPAVTVHAYPIDGAPAPSAAALSDPSNASQEMTLDLEWSGTAAPGATLDAVYAPDGPASNGYSPTDATMEDAVNYAVSGINGVDVVSMSFGSLDGQDLSFQAALSVSFAKASQSGITVLAASGDTGGAAKANCQGGAAPQFPASSPDVIAVGGTAPVLSQDAFGAVTGLDSEPGWDLSGGGFSAVYPAPQWEEVGTAAPPIRANGHRGMPDVAGPSAQDVFFYNGATAYGSGTSFATPMWAGLVATIDALRGAPLGFLTPRLYQVGAEEPTGTSVSGLSDITSGSTCVASAGPGWDAATGWGSPRALQLFEHLAGTYVTVNLSANPSPVAPGGQLTVTVRIVNQTSHAPIGGLPVGIALTGSTSGPGGGTLSDVNVTTNGSGAGVAALQVPAWYYGTTVGVSATVASNGYYGDNSTTVSVNLLGLAGILALLAVFPYNIIAFALIMSIATAIGLYLGGRRRRRAGAAVARVPPAAGPPAAAPNLAMGRPPPPPAPYVEPPPAPERYTESAVPEYDAAQDPGAEPSAPPSVEPSGVPPEDTELSEPPSGDGAPDG